MLRHVNPGIPVGPALAEYPAREHILGLDRHEISLGEPLLASREEAVCLPQADPVQSIAHRTGVGEVRQAHAQRNVLGESLLALRAEAVVLLRQQQLGDREQFVCAVIGEIDVVRDARAHTRIAVEETVHLVLVAGEDHHQIVAIVLHHLQEDFDRFRAVVALVLRLVEVIRFVDEEHTAHRLFQDLLGLGSSVADVLPDQIIARDGHDIGLADIAQTMENFRHSQRDGRLARPGVAGEAHVQRRGAGGEAQLLAQPIHQQQRGGFAYAGLDGLESDQLAVELVQDLLDVGRPQFRVEINRRVVGEQDREGVFRYVHSALVHGVNQEIGAPGRGA